MSEFDEIYKMYFKDVFLYAMSLSKDSSIAEEITQETFFKALKNISKFKGECDIRVWLCQIAKNSYFSMCRKNKKIICDNLEDIDIEEKHNFVDKIINSHEAINVHIILHKMKEPYKEVFSLRMFGELSFGEIARVFGKTESWARVTYHRAKLMIIKEFEEADK